MAVQAEIAIVMPTRKCPECGGVVQPGYTELVYELEYTVRIKDVPANLCADCGHAFVVGRVAAEVNRLVNRVIETYLALRKRNQIPKRPGRPKKSRLPIRIENKIRVLTTGNKIMQKPSCASCQSCQKKLRALRGSEKISENLWQRNDNSVVFCAVQPARPLHNNFQWRMKACLKISVPR
jgi:hypothetical protein